ncbi:MAG: SRPBCC family protein [Sphingobacteriales bacterium]|nr:MAG: SRPBCC family protein [Sphingobacteriales bacterium]
MEPVKKTVIKVTAFVKAPIEKVWLIWTSPEHILHWNAASEDWHTTVAENNLEIGGKYNYRMEAKDGSHGFDFSGTYTNVKLHQVIEYVLDDGREVSVIFESADGGINITETFEAENTFPVELQQAGWQAILNKFKSYTELH